MMRNRNAALNAAFMAVAICTNASAADDHRAAAQAAVKSKLRDPESARFEDVVETALGVCGRVNARNGYGGYAGSMPFAVDMDKGNPGKVLLGDEEIFSEIVIAKCKVWGIPLPQ